MQECIGDRESDDLISCSPSYLVPLFCSHVRWLYASHLRRVRLQASCDNQFQSTIDRFSRRPHLFSWRENSSLFPRETAVAVIVIYAVEDRQLLQRRSSSCALLLNVTVCYCGDGTAVSGETTITTGRPPPTANAPGTDEFSSPRVPSSPAVRPAEERFAPRSRDDRRPTPPWGCLIVQSTPRWVHPSSRRPQRPPVRHRRRPVRRCRSSPVLPPLCLYIARDRRIVRSLPCSR